ncbi:MAG: hypothetical protein M1828_001420 [Chrysothrix sp. TS-e1954]|nr:MAG: hypothetical protein M1828_001420 [Chrysothrix sp. TS-e1954]
MVMQDENMSKPDAPHDEDERLRDASESDADDDSSNDSTNEDSDELIESLVRGRDRRSTAGNRLSALLQQEGGEEDEVDMLFNATEGEDGEFDEGLVEQPSDEDDDSSSSSDDGGNAHAGDVMEGEEQLQKEERAAKKAQKRKAEKSLTKPPAPRKRVRLAEVPSEIRASETAERKRKKSERVSWIPTEEDAPVRTSSRALAVENKERTIASIKESAEKRVKLIASMEAAQKRKKIEKTRPMTQEERLADAARTERLNSKSLNRWEEMEKDRLAKQKARLDALHNRKLEGPAIRWYSGPATWLNGRLKHIGKRVEQEDVQEPQTTNEVTREPEHQEAPMESVATIGSITNTSEHAEKVTTKQNDMVVALRPSPDHVGATPSILLDGIDFYASLPSNTAAKDADAIEDNGAQVQTEMVIQTRPKENDATEASQHTTSSLPLNPKPESTSIATTFEPPVVTHGSINTLTLLNFDESAFQSVDIQKRIILNQKSSAKPIKLAQPLCVITSLPAKYRDPLTGLPYKGSSAFRAIRSMVPNEDLGESERSSSGISSRTGPAWSNLLGAWAGNRKPARGVPEGFDHDRTPPTEIKAES